MPVKSKKLLHFFFFLGIAFILAILGSIPVRIALTQAQFPEPQAIFMLGGNLNRDRATAEFAQKHPQLPIWISVGYPEGRQFFAEANIDPNRINYDNRATDTVTNFTTLLEHFQQNQIRHVYLITSDYHMARSLTIATVIFGSRGIIVTPVAVPSKHEPETTLHIARDLVRSVLWLFTGRSGASLNPRLAMAIAEGVNGDRE
jgi:uncharacterized SAM-binding protein YcdF (DUF218 family)